MNRPALSSRDYLRPPLWDGHLALGKFTLNLSLHRNVAQARGYASHPRIANRVAALRQERGLSHQELAGLLHIHPSTLVALECASYLPSLELALRLSTFFNLSVETIFYSPSVEDKVFA